MSSYIYFYSTMVVVVARSKKIKKNKEIKKYIYARVYIREKKLENITISTEKKEYSKIN